MTERRNMSKERMKRIRHYSEIISHDCGQKNDTEEWKQTAREHREAYKPQRHTRQRHRQKRSLLQLLEFVLVVGLLLFVTDDCYLVHALEWTSQFLPSPFQGQHTGVAVYDLNGDGYLDVLYAAGRHGIDQPFALITLGFNNDGTFRFSEPVPLGEPGGYYQIDVAPLSSLEPGHVAVLLAGGTCGDSTLCTSGDIQAAVVLDVAVSQCSVDQPDEKCQSSYTTIWTDENPMGDRNGAFSLPLGDGSGDSAIVLAGKGGLGVFEPQNGQYTNPASFSLIEDVEQDVVENIKRTAGLAVGYIGNSPGAIAGVRSDAPPSPLIAVYRTPEGEYKWFDFANTNDSYQGIEGTIPIEATGVVLGDLNGDGVQDVLESNFVNPGDVQNGQPIDQLYYLLDTDPENDAQIPPSKLATSTTPARVADIGQIYGTSSFPDIVQAMTDGSLRMFSNLGVDGNNAFMGFEEADTVFLNSGCELRDVKIASLAPCTVSIICATVCELEEEGGNVIFNAQTGCSQAPSEAPTGLSAWPTNVWSQWPSTDPSSLPTNYPTVSPSVSPSASPTKLPSSKPSALPSPSPSASPSVSPTARPSDVPSTTPSISPAPTSSAKPSSSPTSSKAPSASPSSPPTTTPSDTPSDIPSETPSVHPSDRPSDIPSSTPSEDPSTAPTAFPTTSPSDPPSPVPTSAPSDVPSATPSDTPSTSPTVSMAPSNSPSDSPSDIPSASPSEHPSESPTGPPSATPTAGPSRSPSVYPSFTPSVSPSKSPSTSPSRAPSNSPVSLPSIAPISSPSGSPSSTLMPTRDSNRYREDPRRPELTARPTALSNKSLISAMPSDFPSSGPSSVPSIIKRLSNVQSSEPSPTQMGVPTVPKPKPTPLDLPEIDDPMASDFPSSMPSSVPSDIKLLSDGAQLYDPSPTPLEFPKTSELIPFPLELPKVQPVAAPNPMVPVAAPTPTVSVSAPTVPVAAPKVADAAPNVSIPVATAPQQTSDPSVLDEFPVTDQESLSSDTEPSEDDSGDSDSTPRYYAPRSSPRQDATPSTPKTRAGGYVPTPQQRYYYGTSSMPSDFPSNMPSITPSLQPSEFRSLHPTNLPTPTAIGVTGNDKSRRPLPDQMQMVDGLMGTDQLRRPIPQTELVPPIPFPSTDQSRRPVSVQIEIAPSTLAPTAPSLVVSHLTRRPVHVPYPQVVPSTEYPSSIGVAGTDQVPRRPISGETEIEPPTMAPTSMSLIGTDQSRRPIPVGSAEIAAPAVAPTAISLVAADQARRPIPGKDEIAPPTIAPATLGLVGTDQSRRPVPQTENESPMSHATALSLIGADYARRPIPRPDGSIAGTLVVSSSTSSPTIYRSDMPSDTPSSLPTPAPSESHNPSNIPSLAPTSTPVGVPSSEPSETPTAAPTSLPSNFPSSIPSSGFPSLQPSDFPSSLPSSLPSRTPSLLPSTKPTDSPSNFPRPSSVPSDFPSSFPSTGSPTTDQSENPTEYPSPESTSQSPSDIPIDFPSGVPSYELTNRPSMVSSGDWSRALSRAPSDSPSFIPTPAATVKKYQMLSDEPTFLPSSTSDNPTVSRAETQSVFPSDSPSLVPSSVPSQTTTNAQTEPPSRLPVRSPTGRPHSDPSHSPNGPEPSSEPTPEPSTSKSLETASYSDEPSNRQGDMLRDGVKNDEAHSAPTGSPIASSIRLTVSPTGEMGMPSSGHVSSGTPATLPTIFPGLRLAPDDHDQGLSEVLPDEETVVVQEDEDYNGDEAGSVKGWHLAVLSSVAALASLAILVLWKLLAGKAKKAYDDGSSLISLYWDDYNPV